MDTCTFIFKVSSTRRGQPRFHCSQGFINKTRAATLSFQSKFHQQDGGSHAFIPAEFINKYIQTNIHSLTEDPCIFYLFWDKPFTCSHTIITTENFSKPTLIIKPTLSPGRWRVVLYPGNLTRNLLDRATPNFNQIIAIIISNLHRRICQFRFLAVIMASLAA